MFSHVMIGSNDMDRSAKFYDAVMAPLGIKQFMKNATRCGYRGEGPGMFMLCPPHDGGKATFGNGSMLSFTAPSREAVDAFHAAALANGGKDEGLPGPRGNVYMAYVRDPEGNKLAAMHR
jgi:catechol 2,3-dioxygenase-like lactoylglutathione lyase family enzyme